MNIGLTSNSRLVQPEVWMFLQKQINRDTVEEFWNEEVLSELQECRASTVLMDFRRSLGSFLETRGRVFFSATARAALRDLLMQMKSVQRRSVLICDFNCLVVKEAV